MGQHLTKREKGQSSGKKLGGDVESFAKERSLKRENKGCFWSQGRRGGSLPKKTTSETGNLRSVPE